MKHYKYGQFHIFGRVVKFKSPSHFVEGAKPYPITSYESFEFKPYTIMGLQRSKYDDGDAIVYHKTEEVCRLDGYNSMLIDSELEPSKFMVLDNDKHTLSYYDGKTMSLEYTIGSKECEVCVYCLKDDSYIVKFNVYNSEIGVYEPMFFNSALKQICPSDSTAPISKSKIQAFLEYSETFITRKARKMYLYDIHGNEKFKPTLFKPHSTDDEYLMFDIMLMRSHYMLINNVESPNVCDLYDLLNCRQLGLSFQKSLLPNISLIKQKSSDVRIKDLNFQLQDVENNIYSFENGEMFCHHADDFYLKLDTDGESELISINQEPYISREQCSYYYDATPYTQCVKVWRNKKRFYISIGNQVINKNDPFVNVELFIANPEDYHHEDTLELDFKYELIRHTSYASEYAEVESYPFGLPYSGSSEFKTSNLKCTLEDGDMDIFVVQKCHFYNETIMENEELDNLYSKNKKLI